ncbi:PLDc N-terminal domain-containing protein [Cryobacterium sp. M23]|uniref:PLDc N-terminal domain-containing protein n=1 Tax=Cryobacterium sp. M23 TaxID=2048292 RepID=UPI000CE4C5E9|nr:PLDc N-terminal domain-containing protein [Cryobacterium sp. M23]
MDTEAAFAVVLASVVAVVYVAAIAYAMMQIARTNDLSGLERVVWIAGVVFAPLLGALVWFFAGPHPFGFRLTRQVR